MPKNSSGQNFLREQKNLLRSVDIRLVLIVISATLAGFPHTIDLKIYRPSIIKKAKLMFVKNVGRGASLLTHSKSALP